MTEIAETKLGSVFPAALDKLGMITAVIALAGLALQPFSLFRANRIVAAKAEPLWMALPPFESAAVGLIVLIAIGVLIFRTPATLRLFISAGVLVVLALMVGRSASYLTPAGNSYARISPGGGFWIMVFAFSIGLADAVVRKRLTPLQRVGALAAAVLAIGLMLYSGAWDQLSILKEYSNRADAFWRESRVHLILAVGSLLIAAAFGVPLGIACFKSRGLRGPILNVLNVVQTIPSIALFGLLIAPLAWVGRTVPGASTIGIAGIGIAPAFVALVAYALLPIVSNTAAGLDGVPPAARDAARGMGMTAREQLFGVELPLAFPVILTGIRIVLVQNIGMAVIAGLIGGGGLGTFVFQGLSQTATDLVLLGALPVVGMAFAAAILLDALVEASRGQRQTSDQSAGNQGQQA